MRRIAAVDANQSALVKALRDAGATVQPLHSVGGGVPDILCGLAGMNLLFEVKDGAKKPSDRKLTTAQIEWHEKWRGQVCVVSSVAEALDALSNGVALIPFKGVVR
jgi:Holliday junction resolvase